MKVDRNFFIQWKNTNVCLDFWCPECGGQSHFDGYFAYQVRCPYCGKMWRLGNSVSIESGNNSLEYLQAIDSGDEQ